MILNSWFYYKLMTLWGIITNCFLFSWQAEESPQVHCLWEKLRPWQKVSLGVNSSYQGDWRSGPFGMNSKRILMAWKGAGRFPWPLSLILSNSIMPELYTGLFFLKNQNVQQETQKQLNINVNCSENMAPDQPPKGLTWPSLHLTRTSSEINSGYASLRGSVAYSGSW